MMVSRFVNNDMNAFNLVRYKDGSAFHSNFKAKFFGTDKDDDV